MAGGIFMEKNRMKLYFEWRTAVEMAVVLYGILIVIITWLKVFEENGTQAGTGENLSGYERQNCYKYEKAKC